MVLHRPHRVEAERLGAVRDLELLGVDFVVRNRPHMGVRISPGSTEFTSTLSAPYFFDSAFPVAIMAELVAA
jgi:hypothetical protein